MNSARQLNYTDVGAKLWLQLGSETKVLGGFVLSLMLSVSCVLSNKKYWVDYIKVYSVQCTMYRVQKQTYSVDFTLYSVNCTLFSLQCKVNSVHYSVQYTVYNVL